MIAAPPAFDPTLDLVLERDVDVPPALVWAAWTRSEHLEKWFVPRPWSVAECEIDLRPGGIFRTVMRSPEGEEFPNVGCYLEIVPERRLVFTGALGPGYRPTNDTGVTFTAFITLEARGSGTRYTATAIHGTPASREEHERMGFHTGWSTALDQLVEHAKSM
jgi:uncharacterized protein YndB with AHSA1/START domain